MTWTVSASSSGIAYAAASATTIINSTANATFVFCIDMTNMTNGDLFSVKLNTTCTSVTTTPAQQVWKGTWQHVQVNPIKISPPIPSPGIIFNATFQSQAGSTAETFPWQLLSI